MSKSNQLQPGCGTPMMAVDEVVYRRQVYYGGGGCGCQPRRSKSDINVSSPRYNTASPQTTLRVPCSPSVRCSPCNRSVVPPHNTPCSSPYMSSMGPMNVTSNCSKMSLTVPNHGMQPQMVNRSRSASSLDDRGYDAGPLNSTRNDGSRSNVHLGRSDFLSGNSSISIIYRN